MIDKNQNQNLKKTLKLSLYPVHIGCSDKSDITICMGIEKSNHQFLHKKISVLTIAMQASARRFCVFLSTNFLFRRLAKEGRKIGEFREKKYIYIKLLHTPWN